MFSAHACKYGSAGRETARQCSRLLTWCVSGFLFISVYRRPGRDKSRRACSDIYARAAQKPQSLHCTYIQINSKQHGARLQGNMEDSSCMSGTAMHASVRIQSIYLVHAVMGQINIILLVISEKKNARMLPIVLTCVLYSYVYVYT